MWKRVLRWTWLWLLIVAACAPPVSPMETEMPPEAVLVSTAVADVAAPVATVMAQVVAEDDVPTPTPTATPGMIVHTVQTGDSLWALARRYGVPIAAIQLQNGLGASTVVRVGQELTIPPAPAWEGAAVFWVVHEVAPGETLSGIAAFYDLEMVRLREVNGMDAADTLRVGQSLVLPLKTPAEVARALPPTATPRPTATPLPTSTPAPLAATVTATPAPDDATPTIAPTPLPDTPPANLAAWPRAVFNAMNRVRAEHELPPYLYNEKLALAAQRHANDCAQRRSCSHTGSDGSTIQVRVERVGYAGTGAECWAAQRTPQGAVDVWMDEVPPNDAHRRMMLHTWFTEVGVGLAPAPWDGHYYIIAVFGRPR